MNRNQIIESRTDAILTSDPMLARWERSRIYRIAHILRKIADVLYLVTLGGES